MYFIAALSFVLLACQTEAPPPPVPGAFTGTGTVLVNVDGHAITQDMVDATLDALPQRVREQLEKTGQMSQVQDQLVVSELLYQEALSLNLHTQPDIQRSLAMASRNALADAALRKVIDDRSTDDAVQKWYTDHQVQFAQPQVQARHILVKDEAVAKALRAQLDAGADFAKLAGESSKDPGSAKEGGMLGWFPKKAMVEPFASTAFETEKGQIAGPFQTRFGWHIIRVEDKRDSTPLDEVKDQIKEDMKREIAEGYIEEKKKAAKIETPGSAE